MHAKSDLRVFLEWMITGSGSVITDVIPLNRIAVKNIRFGIKALLFLTLIAASLTMGYQYWIVHKRWVDIESLIAKIDSSNDNYEIAKLYENIFLIAKSDLLPDLQEHENDSIALQSAWRMVRGSRNRNSEEGQLANERLARFMDNLETRTNASVPGWWKGTLERGMVRVDNSSLHHPLNKYASPYHMSGMDGVACPRHSQVESSALGISYQTGPNRINLPEELLHEGWDGKLQINISGRFTDNFCYLAIHDDVGCRHEITCLDRTKDRLVWQVDACGCDFGGRAAYGGGGNYFTWICVVPTDDDRILVYGLGTLGFWVHGFRSTDGTPLFRFSSSHHWPPNAE